MPNIEGVVLRKVLPVFAVLQEFGDKRDAVYRSVLNGLLRKYQWINEQNADAEVCMHLIKFNAKGISAANSLLNIDNVIDFDAFLESVEMKGSFENVLEVLSKALSVSGCLCAEVGYYKPIIFFLVDDIRFSSASARKINAENNWYRCATRLAIPFSDKSDIFRELLGTRRAVFPIARNSNENRINRLVNAIYDIRINSRALSMSAGAFAQTGEICAAMHRGEDKNVESLQDLSKKGQQLKDLVRVDPVFESKPAQGEPAFLGDALALTYVTGKAEQPEELFFDDEHTGDIDSEELLSGSEGDNNS